MTDMKSTRCKACDTLFEAERYPDDTFEELCENCMGHVLDALDEHEESEEGAITSYEDFLRDSKDPDRFSSEDTLDG